MEITPEIQEKINRVRKAIEKTQLAFRQSVPAEVRLQLNQNYDRFRKQLSDSEILRMVLKAEVITPREPIHSWDYPLRPAERDDAQQSG